MVITQVRYLIVLLAICSSAFAQDDSRVSFDEKSLSLGDCDLYYKTTGEGPPLLLLHGFLDSAELWDPFVEALSKQHTLIIPDLRGHGNSTNSSGSFTFKQSAKDITALMDHLKIQQFDAVGYSAGAFTLMHMAISNPDQIKKLVLLGSASYLSEDSRKNLRTFSQLDDLPAEFRAHLLSIHKQGQGQVGSLIKQFRAFAEDYDDPSFTPPMLKKITASTLMINGDSDIYFPLEIAFQQYTEINDSSLWVIPHRGHELIFYDASDELQREFIRIAMAHLRSNIQ